MDGFEQPRAGIVREVQEELNCTFTPKALIGAYGDHYFWKDKDYAVTILSFAGTLKGAASSNHEITTLEWVPLNKIPPQLAFAHMHDSIRDLKRYLRTK